jgi:hypothetical protein
MGCYLVRHVDAEAGAPSMQDFQAIDMDGAPSGIGH